MTLRPWTEPLMRWRNTGTSTGNHGGIEARANGTDLGIPPRRSGNFRRSGTGDLREDINRFGGK